MEHPSEFFQALYSQVTHGLAEIRLLHKSGDYKLAKKIYRPATAIHTGDFDYLASLNTDYHIYHRVNISEESKSTKPFLTQVVALWLEIDNASPEVEERLIEYHFPPTTLIHSGNGYHAYWMLKQPFYIQNDRDRHEIERTLEGMILDWGKDSGGDAHTKDITRILRTPFFYNIKDKYAPDYPLCRVVWHDGSMGDRYKLEWLHKRYAPLGTPPAPTIRRSLPVTQSKDKPQWILDYLGSGAGAGSRNQRLFVVARWFNDIGNKSAEAEQDLMTRALADGLSQHEAMNTIKSAWNQAPNASNGLDSTMRKRYILGDKLQKK